MRKFREHLDPCRCLYCAKWREDGWPYRAYARFDWHGEELMVPLVFCSQTCSIDYERMRKWEGSSYDPKLAYPDLVCCGNQISLVEELLINAKTAQQLWRCLRCEGHRFNLDHWYGGRIPAGYGGPAAQRHAVARRVYTPH